MEEGCSKMSAGGAVSGLPDDLLVEILSRVPAKSVCRFKCVSKAWRDLIADPDHHKKLRHRHRQPMQGLFIQGGEYTKVDNRLTFHNHISFIDLMTVRSVPLALDISPSFSFLTEMAGIKALFLLDSCNGLILLGHGQEPSHDYVVCNPTTKKWLQVPACGSRAALTNTYLAFDPAVSFHFHLVQFQMQRPDVEVHVVSVHVYSSETGTWGQNQIDEQKEQGQLEGWHHQFTLEVLDDHCAFVDGFLHLIVWGPDRQQQHILVVDTQGKARRIISVPDVADGSQWDDITHYLGQSQGHLHCVITIESADENNDKLSIWVLQDYDTQEWVLKSTVNSLDVFGQTKKVTEYQVVDIHQDCNVLFFSHPGTRELIAYDMDHKEASVIATFNNFKFRDAFARYVPYFSESPALTNIH